MAYGQCGCGGRSYFLPSFLFILAGGPLVESTHGNLKFTAPLSAITAAVVGVILNLAVFFAWHVFWPQGFTGRFDGIAGIVPLQGGSHFCHRRLRRSGTVALVRQMPGKEFSYEYVALVSKPAFAN